jgi:glycosyltransferase involved in cell wall biosynthesis
MVVFEAMAAGVPVIATNVGGVPEMLSPEEAVFVPRDDPAALAAAIRAAFRAPAAARARAARAGERLHRDFGTEPWCERYDAIYHLVTSGSSPVPVLP